VIIASLLSTLIWAMELGFWTACQTKSNDAVPDLCPVIFKNGKDILFTLEPTLGPAKAAVYLAAVSIVLYVSPFLHIFPRSPVGEILTHKT
jgi:hypothetical protein